MMTDKPRILHQIINKMIMHMVGSKDSVSMAHKMIIPTISGKNNILRMRLPTIKRFLAEKEGSNGRVLTQEEEDNKEEIRKRAVVLAVEVLVEELTVERNREISPKNETKEEKQARWAANKEMIKKHKEEKLAQERRKMEKKKKQRKGKLKGLRLRMSLSSKEKGLNPSPLRNLTLLQKESRGPEPNQRR